MASRVTTVTSDIGIPTLTLQEEPQTVTHQNNSQTIRLVLKKPKRVKKVVWSEETIDNEGMNKKKSKCCCIYKKPHAYGESSSESEEDCENCIGHSNSSHQKTPNHAPPPVTPPASISSVQ